MFSGKTRCRRMSLGIAENRWMRETLMQRRFALGAGRVAASLAFLTLLALAGCATATSATSHIPVPTPTSTPVITGPLASVVGPVVGGQAHRISADYDASARQATITLTIGAAPDVAAAQARVMELCYRVQKAVWTSNPSLREVKVIVLGPIHDDYADIIEDAYGVADVLAPTATKLSWDALSPEAAWSRYDNTWMRASYLPNWLYGHGN